MDSWTRGRWVMGGALAVAMWAMASLYAQSEVERPPPENYDQWRDALHAEAATAAESLEAIAGFEVELLRSARPGEGSWISMAFDPQGRLTISREDQGLVRLIIPDIPIDPRYEVPHPPSPPPEEDEDVDANAEDSPDEEEPLESVESEFDPFFLRAVEETLKECRGLLYAYDALYANANNSKGLYRLRDTSGDGRFDEVTLLRHTPGGVGHGRNDLALGPDGLIYSMHGNDVQLPKDYELGSSPYRHYQVDALLPCEWNKYLFNAGATVPAGHLVRTDAEGKLWEVVAGGMRNPFGIAFNEDGEAFTYDADMEWDEGAPWYRPTRVHHLVSGADYGWRQGTGKWPAWYPESLPANLDVGLGSPTALEFGTKSNFPEKYRRALFMNEWAYGRILAVHLTPAGASYEMEMETFLQGRPLNVTDLAFGPDGHLYFITGGRKTQSGLYRVKYAGEAFERAADEDTSTGTSGDLPHGDAGHASQRAADGEGVTDTSGDVPHGAAHEVARAQRRRLEAFHGVEDGRAVGVAWPYLASDDLWLRHAARVAIESQPPANWQKRALEETDATAGLTALLALARVGNKDLQPKILTRLGEFPLGQLDSEQRLIALRAYQLAFIRMGPPNEAAARRLAARLLPHYPGEDERADRLLCELLVYLGAPEVIERTAALLEGDRSETEKLHYLFTLRHVKEGWTMRERETYFLWLRKARGFAGAQYIPRFVHYIEQDSLANLTPQQREAITPILSAKSEEPAVNLGAGRETVKEWKLIDFIFSLDEVGKGRDFERGKQMFAVARCNQCHRMAGEGKAFGPDLTDVARRFSRRDVLMSILAPSAVIAEKYQAVRFVMNDGKIVTGLVISEDDQSIHVSADPQHPDMLVALAKGDIEEQSPSPVSTMPEGLLNTLTLEEILDLLAFIESGGDPQKEHFK